MSTKKPTSEADEVFETLHTIMHRFRASLHRRLRDTPDDLGHMEKKTIGFFARHPGATLSDLVEHSGRDKAQLARLILGLKTRGLLATEPCIQDKRSTRLYLTEQAESLHARVHEQGERIIERAMTGISPEECKQLQALLMRINENLEKEYGQG